MAARNPGDLHVPDQSDVFPDGFREMPFQQSSNTIFSALDRNRADNSVIA